MISQKHSTPLLFRITYFLKSLCLDGNLHWKKQLQAVCRLQYNLAIVPDLRNHMGQRVRPLNTCPLFQAFIKMYSKLIKSVL